MIIKLLQWNVWYLEKVENIIQTLREISPDILCLQELSTNTESNPGISTGGRIKEALGLNAVIHTAQSWKGWHKDSQENGIFSCYPIVDSSSTYLRVGHEPELRDYAREGRVYLEASTEIGNKVLSVGTTHLSYSHMFETNKERSFEEQRLMELLQKRKNFVFAADLNTHPKTKLISQLQMRFKHAGPELERKTWTTKPFDYQGFKEDSLNWRLDYVFCTSDIKVIHAEVVDSQVSDHLPLLVEFEW